MYKRTALKFSVSVAKRKDNYSRDTWPGLIILKVYQVIVSRDVGFFYLNGLGTDLSNDFSTMT
jgi:hypothetical protein